MGDRNLTSFPENKFSTATDGQKKKKYPPPTHKPLALVTSNFTALDVGSLAGAMYTDSGLLMRENVIYNLYDPTSVDPDKELIFENKNKDSIDEFDYKSLSVEEKRLLLERLMEVEERGFSPEKSKSESPEPEEPESESPTPKRIGKRRFNRPQDTSSRRSKSPSSHKPRSKKDAKSAPAPKSPVSRRKSPASRLKSPVSSRKSPVSSRKSPGSRFKSSIGKSKDRVRSRSSSRDRKLLDHRRDSHDKRRRH